MSERRKYRFRAWDSKERAMYPVIMIGRGVVIIKDELSERTRRLDELTLMQFSGIRDTRDQEIYEGDTVELEFEGVKKVRRIVLQDGSFRIAALASEHDRTRLLSSATVTNLKIRVTGTVYT